ncbi:MAG: hypothetical protein WCQ65_11600 [Fermentimonas sp.]
MTPTHGSTFHIPAPFFLRSYRRIDFIFNLPVAEDTRGHDYYSCPRCGEKSFFSGLCWGCQTELYPREFDEEVGEVIEYDLTSMRYRNHEALKRASKKEFLRRLDQGIPDLGILSAEFVVAEEEEEEEEEEGSDDARRQVDGVWQHKHEGYDYWHPMARVHREEKYRFPPRPSFEDSDDFVNEIVRVEGSDEVRRQVDGVWYHKHEGHDYWHSMAGFHRED